MNYRSVVSAVSLASLLGMSIPMTVWGASRPGDMNVSVLSGQVSQKLSTDDNWKAVGLSVPAAGTWIRTGANSEAVVALPGHVSMRLCADSQVQVLSVAGGRVSMNFKQGRAYASISGVGDDSLRLIGPDSSIAACSGNFVADVSNGKTRLQVIDGNATLSGQRIAFGHFPAKGKSAGSASVPAGVEAVAEVDGPVADVNSVQDGALLAPPAVVAANTADKLSDDPLMDAIALDGSDVRARKGDADKFSRRRTRTKANTGVKPQTPPPVEPPPVEPPPVPPEPQSMQLQPIGQDEPMDGPTIGGGGSFPYYLIPLLGGAIYGLTQIGSGGGSNVVPNVINVVVTPEVVQQNTPSQATFLN
jgi:hypothetical protein